MARLVFKIEDEAFEKRLQEVEEYLSKADWTLAKILVDTLIADYDTLYFKKLKLELDAKKAEKRRRVVV